MRKWAVLAALFALPLGTARAAESERNETIAVKDIKPGMKGYGLTVFQGTKPERFDVHVIGVLHNFRPLEDIILIMCDDKRLQYSGGVAGMSGSPIYIEGKLAGAFAYGFQFAKDPIAGVTPIEYMLKEVKRPRRGPDGITGMAKGDANDAQAANDRDRSVREVLAEASGGGDRRWWREIMPRTNVDPSGQLVRAAVPLSASGFAGRALEELETAFKPYGMVPMAGAGGGRVPGAKGPTSFGMGDAIGVELVRGDMSMVGTGTVTWVEGKNVAAFGHPMFGAGELYLPVVTAQIHTFLNSVAMSFKLSSPLVEAGTLVQDRESCIVADTGGRTGMIPIHVRISGPGGKNTHTFNAEIARFKFLTPLLASAVVSNAATTYAPDVTHAVATIKSRVAVHGHAPLELEDNLYAPDGLAGRALAQVSGIRAMAEVLFNPFQPAAVDAIDIDINVAYRPDFAEITGLRMNSDEVDAGSRVNLYVSLRPFAGDEYVETIPIEIPRSLAGQALKIEASAGNLVRPDMAAPENLKELVDNLRKQYSSRAIVVTLQTPDEGATIHGKLLPDLPASEIDTLRPSSSTKRGDPYRRFARTQKMVARVLTGKQDITVRVRDTQQ
jgi:SpoIVB peptidase S55